MALIEDYGLIGDLQSAALVGRDGSVDWLCLPRFDSGALFAALLGDKENGHWTIQPEGEFRSSARYRGDTLVLETELETETGAVRLIDFMPPRERGPDLVRIVEGVEDVEMRMELVLRFDYGSIVPWVRTLDGDLLAIAGPDAVVLRTPRRARGRDLRTVASFTVAEGDRVPFVLRWFPSNETPPEPIEPEEALADTCRSGRTGPRAARTRALARRGASLAADSEGAHVRADRRDRRGPDDVAAGVDRRRAELGLPLLLAPRRDPHAARAGRVPATSRRRAPGATGSSVRSRASPEDLQIMYGVAGERRLTEFELPWLSGYEGSQPVRVGNGASRSAPARRLRRGRRRAVPVSPPGSRSRTTAWALTGRVFDWLESALARARRGDLGGARAAAALHALEGHGLGRLRPRRQDDRALRPRRAARPLEGGAQGDPGRGAARGLQHRARRVHAVLRLGSAGCELPVDPARRLPARRRARVVGTVERDPGDLLRTASSSDTAPTRRTPSRRAAARRRRFPACSFWLAASSPSRGEHDEAVELYERLLALRNDVGLISEEYDPERGRLVGNFPQAFTHIGIVKTALLLDKALAENGR